MPAEGVSPRVGTQAPDPSLGTGYFAAAKFRHDSESRRSANCSSAKRVTHHNWVRCPDTPDDRDVSRPREPVCLVLDPTPYVVQRTIGIRVGTRMPISKWLTTLGVPA